jgi:glutaredoxin
MKVVVWSKYNCTFCDQAKLLLGQKEIAFEEKKIGTARSVPQIIIDGKVIGGLLELKEFLK